MAIENCVCIEEDQYEVQFLFVADFKVRCSIAGASDTLETYPCPFFLVRKRSVTAIPTVLLQDLNMSSIESL